MCDTCAKSHDLPPPKHHHPAAPLSPLPPWGFEKFAGDEARPCAGACRSTRRPLPLRIVLGDLMRSCAAMCLLAPYWANGTDTSPLLEQIFNREDARAVPSRTMCGGRHYAEGYKAGMRHAQSEVRGFVGDLSERYRRNLKLQEAVELDRLAETLCAVIELEIGRLS